MRSPQTTGLERPSPGIGVFQSTLMPFATSQVVGVSPFSEMPLAEMPRNCGQSTPGFGALAAESRNESAATSTIAAAAKVKPVIDRMRMVKPRRRACYTTFQGWDERQESHAGGPLRGAATKHTKRRNTRN